MSSDEFDRWYESLPPHHQYFFDALTILFFALAPVCVVGIIWVIVSETF